MKILIVSDTHGRSSNLEKVLELVSPVDAMIHCGDVEDSEEYIEVIAQCPVYMVAGNNDFFSDLPREREEMIGGKRFFITHGHYHGVAMDLKRIREDGEDRGADVVAFGHTHRPVIKHKGGITLVNPGSLSYPRQAGRKPTYIIMTIDREGQANYEIYELEE